MSEQKLFYFKSRMSDKDWERLQVFINISDADTLERAWLCKEVSAFCKEIAIPILAQIKEDEKRPQKIEKTVWIPRVTIGSSNNHEIIKTFADYKALTPTQIIQRYIIDRRLIPEEIKLIFRR